MKDEFERKTAKANREAAMAAQGATGDFSRNEAAVTHSVLLFIMLSFFGPLRVYIHVHS